VAKLKHVSATTGSQSKGWRAPVRRLRSDRGSISAGMMPALASSRAEHAGADGSLSGQALLPIRRREDDSERTRREQPAPTHRRDRRIAASLSAGVGRDWRILLPKRRRPAAVTLHPHSSIWSFRPAPGAKLQPQAQPACLANSSSDHAISRPLIRRSIAF